MSSQPTHSDAAWMRRALELAQRGRGRTWPNPMVGSVVVRDGQLLAEGFHHRCGEDHAEVDALAKVGFRAEGATLYVNLEPCCHWGRTPPCTDAILRSGVRRAVVGMVDPQPLVAGKGIDILRNAGVEVEVGLHEAACHALNEVHIVHVAESRPFVTLKAAVTADGRSATRSGKSQWITGETARAHVHRERAQHQAVGVGVGTVLADDPRLTVRDEAEKTDVPAPIRVVFDSQLRTPPAARLFESQEPVLLCTTDGAAQDELRARPLRNAGAEILACGAGERLDLPQALAALGERPIASLLIEGGAELHGSLLDGGLIDRLLVYVAPKIFGGAEALPLALGRGVDTPEEALALTPFAVTRLGPDLLLEARPLGGPGASWWAEHAQAGWGG